MQGQLSCEHCGDVQIRRYRKERWDDHDRWLCRPCIIARLIIKHARERMRRVRHQARHYPSLLMRHSSNNIEKNLKAARSRARRRHLPATLQMTEWKIITTFFGNVCAYCGDKWEQIEHATPLCRGGGTTLANCLPTCESCNSAKRQHTLEELLVRDLWPHRTERLESALRWLQQYGRTSTDPSGQVSLENAMLAELRKRESAGMSCEWIDPNVDVVLSLSRRGLISAQPAAYWNTERRWTIQLTKSERAASISTSKPDDPGDPLPVSRAPRAVVPRTLGDRGPRLASRAVTRLRRSARDLLHRRS
jgi:hypothetical protein